MTWPGGDPDAVLAAAIHHGDDAALVRGDDGARERDRHAGADQGHRPVIGPERGESRDQHYEDDNRQGGRQADGPFRGEGAEDPLARLPALGRSFLQAHLLLHVVGQSGPFF